MAKSARFDNSAWSAVCLYPGRVDVARVKRQRDAKPQVEVLESYERAKGDKVALASLGKRFGLKKARCTTLLGSGEYQVLQIDAPQATDPEERKAEIGARLGGMVDMPLAHATIDAVEIPTAELAPGRPKNAYAVVAGNAAIAPKVVLFHEAGVGLAAIDIPELAQRNIAALCEQPNRGLAFLAFGEQDGLLTFTCNGELYLHRHIEIGLAQLLTDDLDRRSSLFDRIGLELQRSLDSFDRTYGFIPVGRVLLGPYAEAQALQGFLRDYLSMQVDVLDLADVLDFPSVPELKRPERQAQCLLTLGAALREEGGAS
jgi:MSHA biogenesis protein MshI